MPNSALLTRPVSPHRAGMGDGLRRLIEAARSDVDLRLSLGSASSLGDLVEWAGASGHVISVRELQLWAHHPDLQSSFWPWAALDPDQRLLFFRCG